MTHDSALRTVVSLVPEITKQGAEEVLTDYARQHDLPPAQLEKLAQVYNTMRTIGHIDNASADARGDSVPMLDVPMLVLGYATGIGSEKAAAAPSSVESHDPRRIDLNRMLRDEAFPELSKAASQSKALIAEVAEQFVVKLAASDVQAALLDVELDLADEISKLACELFSAAPVDSDRPLLRDVSDFEREALQTASTSIVKSAGDYLETFAAAHHTRLVRHDYSQEITKYAFPIQDEQGEKFAKLGEKLHAHDVIIKMAGKVTQEQLDQMAEQSPDAGFSMPEPINADVSTATSVPDPVVIDDVDQLEQFGETGGETDDDDRKKQNRGGGGGGGGDDKSKSSGKDKGSAKGEGSGSVGKAVLGAIGVPLGAASKTIQGAASKADELLTRITSKERENKGQRSTDMSVADIKRAMNVRRLIGTDPVLREHDPKVVLEVYNSIAARNPELAGDMASIRLILREAVSYEGLTLDSQKMLAEIRRNSSDAEQKSEDIEKRRYSVGGVAPIKIN